MPLEIAASLAACSWNMPVHRNKTAAQRTQNSLPTWLQGQVK